MSQGKKSAAHAHDQTVSAFDSLSARLTSSEAALLRSYKLLADTAEIVKQPLDRPSAHPGRGRARNG